MKGSILEPKDGRQNGRAHYKRNIKQKIKAWEEERLGTTAGVALWPGVPFSSMGVRQKEMTF